MRTSWREMLLKELEVNNDSFDYIESSTMTSSQMDEMFDVGFGGVGGIQFTVWTKDYVYFPASYDGVEWVGSVARNPNGKPTQHIGGGN